MENLVEYTNWLINLPSQKVATQPGTASEILENEAEACFSCVPRVNRFSFSFIVLVAYRVAYL